jgi:hypothetical protein
MEEYEGMVEDADGSGDDEDGWTNVTKQEAGATGPAAAVTGAVETAAATGATAAASGAASAATGATTAGSAVAKGASGAVTRPAAEERDATGLDGGHRGGGGGLALPPAPSHGGYRGPPLVDIMMDDVVAALPKGRLTLANLTYKERRGLTNAAHSMEQYAYIPASRVEELIAGEEWRTGVSFLRPNEHTSKSEADTRPNRAYCKRETLQCYRGPVNNAKSAMEVVAATVATRAAATAAKTVARTGIKTVDGRSLKIGCKCCFKINTLAAQPQIAEVVASRFPHTAQCGFMRGGLSPGTLAGWASH